MAPKKKEVQKLSLNEFMQDSSFGGGNWADEVEETYASGTQPLPATERRFGGGASSFGGTDRYAGYARQERSDFPQTLPDKPPYTAHLGNLSYDATQETVTDFFTGCEVVSVRIVEDRAEMRPKGFGYAEFATVDGLKKALELDGQSFSGRNIRIRIADPPKDRQDGGRDLDWGARRGPLAAEPPRNDRRRDFNEARAPREAGDESRFKDLSWERKGPLSPTPSAVPMERGGSRDGSRPRRTDSRADSFMRGTSPAAWGPGEGRQEGSRPPRREFVERPERAPTAAERDNQWRSSMRPDAPPARSPAPSRPGSEAPSSPALTPAAPVAPAGRPRLNLQKRTVTDAPGVMSPSLTGDSKASPFGAARPIDTAAREREIAEKHEQAMKEKKEAEEKAREERRLAKEAAAKEAAEKAAAEETAKPNGNAEQTDAPTTEATPEAPQAAEPEKTETGVAGEAGVADENGENATEQKIPTRPKEPREPAFKSRATESGSWRQSSGDRTPRGPPRERRGGGAPRGGRGMEERQSSRRGEPSTPTTPVVDEDGWTTVPAGAKGRRGRPVVS